MKTDSSDQWLVVEGFISDNYGDHEIRLSWSTLFTDQSVDHVSDAKVKVIEDEVNEIPFILASNGKYVPEDSCFVALSDRKYQLEVRLSDGRTIKSEVLMLQCAPEIKEISFKANSTFLSGVDQVKLDYISLLLSNEMDDLSSGFYRYQIDETYLHVAPFATGDIYHFEFYRDQTGRAFYVKHTDTIISDVQNRFCWFSDSIRTISVQASHDYLNTTLVKAPIHQIPVNVPKLLHRYSPLVHQYAIDETAYNFYRLITLFSEEEGLLFNKQPDKIDGNVYPLDDGPQVIGLFQVSGKTSKRIYIDFEELPTNIRQQLIKTHLKCAERFFQMDMIDKCMLEIIEKKESELTIEEKELKQSFIETNEEFFHQIDSLQESGHKIVFQDLEVLECGHILLGSVTIVKQSCSDCGSFDGYNFKPDWWIDG